MADITEQNDKKTVVAFIVGLLIGGLLVWAFSGPAADAPTKSTKTGDEKEVSKEEGDTKTTTEATDETAAPADSVPVVKTLPVGEGKVVVGTHAAGSRVTLDSATFPMGEGWIGVRDYADDRLGSLLGVARFSEEQGLVPTEIVLQRATKAGAKYAVVMYSESGDRVFSLANDVQVDNIFATFTAQ